jgi:hypothetical protein
MLLEQYRREKAFQNDLLSFDGFLTGKEKISEFFCLYTARVGEPSLIRCPYFLVTLSPF